MTKLKSPSSNGAADSELIATIEEQSAELRLLRKEVAEWRKKYEKGEVRDIAFTNSEKEIQAIYTPLDAAETSAEALGMPGFYPYTRGIHPTGYRGRLWTMRQFSGFGTAEDTNRRYKFLLAHGQTGLSVAFDFPTLMGYDSDHPRSEGEVGKCGVAISSLADMETLFDGIPLDRVSTSMTINGPAVILYCFYIAAAEKQGIDSTKLRGTIQNDILKEYMAQHAWVYPIESALAHDALPFPDRGCDAHRAATHEQRRSRRLPGNGRRARWNPVAAHEFHGRNARAPNRGIGTGRAPHPAGSRVRERNPQCHRSTWRLVLRRNSYHGTRTGSGDAVQADRGSWRSSSRPRDWMASAQDQ